jgi:FkbM family methyltransferase
MKFKLFYRFCRFWVNKYNSDDNDNIYTNGELNWLKNQIKSATVIFDVGANIGDWTKLCLILKPNAVIHCFEPSNYTFEKLINNTRNYANIVYNNIGLGSIKSNHTLYCIGKGLGTNSFYQREGIDIEQSSTEQILVDTLDDYCINNKIIQIDILKIDVEGHELEVLNGAQKLLSSGKIKCIQFEYGGTYIDSRILLKDIFDLLLKNNYKLFKMYPHRLVYIENYEQVYENFKYSNWVAIHNSTI